MITTKGRIGAATLFSLAATTLITSSASAQTVPAIERAAGTCTGCAPDGWTTVDASPDVIVGDGTWPGGGYTVAEVGSAAFGSNMAFLLRNNSGNAAEGIATNVSGLVPNARYEYTLKAQGCQLSNSTYTYTPTGGTLNLSAAGETTTFVGASNDVWTDVTVRFNASATGTATLTAQMGSTDSPTGFGTCIVVDSDTDALTRAGVDLDVPTLTNDDTPTITGTSVPNDAVVVEIRDASGTLMQTLNATADSNGDWSVDAAMLADGDYEVSATANNAGMTNPSSDGPDPMTVDTTAPVTTLTAPASDASVQAVVVTGTTESDASVLIEIIDGSGNVVASDTPTPDGQGAVTYSPTLSDGTYSVRITATDAAGNETVVTHTGATVDTLPPAISVSAPTQDGLVGPMTSVAGTTEPNLEVTVTLTDDGGNTIETATVTADANGDWTAMFAGLTDGDVTATAVSTDAAGNSAEEAVDFTVDTTIPAVAISAPDDNAALNDTTPDFEGTVSDGAMLTLELLDATNTTVAIDAAMIDASGAWTSTPSADLAEGEYTLNATAIRTNGLMAMASVSFVIDLTAPVTAITYPANGMVTSENQPTLTGTSEAGAEITVVVTDDMGNVVYETTTTAGEDGGWSVALDAPLDDGDYTVDATATDDAGNVDDGATAEIQIDATVPTVQIVAPMNGDSFELGTSIDVEVVDEALTQLELFVDGESVATDPSSDGAWTVTLEADSLGLGEHTLQATSTDEAGNIGRSGEVTITIVEPADDTDDMMNDDMMNDDPNGQTPIISGGTEDGCGCATPASQTEGKLGWLALLMGALFIRRRRG